MLLSPFVQILFFKSMLDIVSVPEWSKGKVLSTFGASLVGSTPTGYIGAYVSANILSGHTGWSVIDADKEGHGLV